MSILGEPAHSQRQPNIVLIHCHDLGDWLSTYGYRGVPDSRLQDFAEHSLVFDSAFATAPLCTPARSSLFTGQMPHQNGLMGLTHQGWRYAEGVRTLPEMLSPLGYHTTLIGLQHEDFDARVLGFDEVLGLGFIPRALEVARLVQRWYAHNQNGSPYFATIGMWEVHRPWPPEDYRPADPASVDVPPYLPDNGHTRADIAGFYGAIRQMDEAFELILSAIDASPDASNTIVIFTTDHGAAFPRAKSTLYDSGVKVTLLIRPPLQWGVPPARVKTLASHLDIAPTLVELAGGSVREELAGRSLAPLLLGATRDLNETRELFFEKTYHDRYDPMRAIRTNDAKYIRNYVNGPLLPLPADLENSETRAGMGNGHLGPRPREELYLLGDDPWELSNLAQSEHHAELKAGLSEDLDRFMEESSDPLLEGDVDEPPEPYRR
ncbi:sulfatase [Pseudarthrobacter sp. NamE2]|uniref:sulfatase family protein n=1 Tax=Pseudarthrobacter sp. NamE2 TaxID=2576838 RepID=UPI0010FD5B9A|nr:sulfatase [Pseudarthrobacter sp. NamE2]TLM86264.1 sulfatase [Pseudarthrobacter sp. NamE2]